MVRLPLEIINKKLTITQIKQWILLLRKECSLTNLNKYSGSTSRNYKTFKKNLELLLPQMEVPMMPYVTLSDKFTNQLLKYKHKHTILMAIMIENKLRINHKIRLGIDFFKNTWGIEHLHNIRKTLQQVADEIVGFDVSFKENMKGRFTTSIDVTAHRIITANPTNRPIMDLSDESIIVNEKIEAVVETRDSEPQKKNIVQEKKSKESSFTNSIIDNLVSLNAQTFERLRDCISIINQKNERLLEFIVKEKYQLLFLENNNFQTKLSRALGGIGIIIREANI